MKTFALLLCLAPLCGQGAGRIASKYSPSEFDLTVDATTPAWKNVTGVFAENNSFGVATPGHRTEIRSRWTAKNIYFLFVCPYAELNLKPDPQTTETNKLWDWDVAEVFAGADFANVRHYREFQVSPQGEWVDLDIDRDRPLSEGGWKWNADGFAVKARIDRDRKIWYGEMRIPLASIDTRKPEAGNELRVNFYRLQGPKPNRAGIAWQPTNAPSYHVPEAFGRLVLAPK